MANAATITRRRVFYISPWRRAVLYLALGPFVLVGAGLATLGDPEARAIGIVLIVFMGAMLACWQWLVIWTRLELSEQGIRLRQLGMPMRTGWSNIDAIRLDRGREGFITRAPPEGKGAARLARLRGFGIGGPLYDAEQQAAMAERRWIPIEPFARYLRKGTLASDIRELAPHLSGMLTEEALQAPHSPAFPTRKRGVLVFVIIFGALAAAGLSSALPDDEGVRWVETLAGVVIAPLVAIRFGWSARNSLRHGSRVVSAMFGLLCLFAVFVTLVFWGELAKSISASSGP